MHFMNISYQLCCTSNMAKDIIIQHSTEYCKKFVLLASILPQDILYTVDGERFTGLNICGFSAIKAFTEIVLHCLGHKCLLFSTVKERHLYSRKNFCGTPENRENAKV